MINVKNFSPPEIDKKEILRYAGVKETSSEIEKLLMECLEEIKGKLSFRICWGEFPVTVKDGVVDFGFAKTESEDLQINLKECKKVIIFAASIGIEIDRIIAKYSALSPSKSVMFQAIGSERVESLCDAFNEEIKSRYKRTKPRFSSGYGDLSLEFQKDLFGVLDCRRKIGVALNESLLMSPSKSVTAIIGIQGE